MSSSLSAVVALLTVGAVASAPRNSAAASKPLKLPKCCAPREALDPDLQRCIPVENVKESPLYLDNADWAHLTDAADSWNYTGALSDCSARTDGAIFPRVVRNRADSSIRGFTYEHWNDGGLVRDRHGDSFDRFCVEQVVEAGQVVATAAAFCERERNAVCHNKPCFDICCPEKHAFQQGECRAIGVPLPPTKLHEDKLDKDRGVNDKPKPTSNHDIRYFYKQGFEESCINDGGTIMRVVKSPTSTRLLDNGWLEANIADSDSIPGAGQNRKFKTFCIRHHFRAPSAFQEEYVVCILDPGSQDEWGHGAVHANAVKICMGISLVFYAATFAVVYHRRRTSLFGVMLLVLVFSLTSFNVFYLLHNFLPPVMLLSNPFLCMALAFATQFSYIFSCMWFLTLAFNVYDTFRVIRDNSNLMHRRDGFRHPHFKWFFGLSFLVSLIFSGGALLAQLLLPESMSDWKPGFGEKRCYADKDRLILQWVYFRGICAAANVVTILFHAVTAFKLMCGVWRRPKGPAGCNAVRIGDSQQRKRLKLVIKLVVVLGLPWLAENFHESIMPSVLASIVDSFNALQGLVLFLVMLSDYSSFKELQNDFKASLKSSFWFCCGCKNTRTRSGFVNSGEENVQGERVKKREYSHSDVRVQEVEAPAEVLEAVAMGEARRQNSLTAGSALVHDGVAGIWAAVKRALRSVFKMRLRSHELQPVQV